MIINIEKYYFIYLIIFIQQELIELRVEIAYMRTWGIGFKTRWINNWDVSRVSRKHSDTNNFLLYIYITGYDKAYKRYIYITKVYFICLLERVSWDTNICL